MKKLVILMICLLISANLFAVSFVTSSFGLSMMKFNESVYDSGYYLSVIEKSTAMNIDLRSSFFGNNSTFGFNIGLSILYPISSSVDGTEVQTEFFNANWCPQIGISAKYLVSDALTMVANFGYEMLFNYSAKYNPDLNATISSTLFVHGFYGNDTFIYKVSEKMNLNFGFAMYFPIWGSQKFSAKGYASEQYSYNYSGLSFEPFIGFSIKR